METHELANIIPNMSDDEYKALKLDIQTNGLFNPIMLYEHKILDGRNRYKACKELNIEPKYENYQGDSPVSYVLSLNIKRRHLNSSQLACIAVDILPYLKEEAKKRMESGINQYSPMQKIAEGKKGRSIDKAAEKIEGTNPEYIRQAQELKKETPEIFERVKNNEINLNKAYKELKFKKAKEKVIKQNNDDLSIMTQFGIELKLYNIWNFSLDDRFGIKHFGQQPAGEIFNILYYFTKQKDLIYDVFAGGGIVLDVCKVMKRECYSTDIQPTRKEIIKMDITKQLPDINPKLIYIDPPYPIISKGKYSQEESDFSNMDINMFFKNLEDLRKRSKEKYKNSYIADIIGGTKDIN